MKRNTPLLSRLAALVCAAAFMLITIPGQAQPQSLLTRHVREEIVSGRAQFVGQLPATQTLRFDIVMPLRDRAGLQSFVQEVQDPASPFHHQFLTPQEFTARFGPTQEDWDALVAFAKASGFEIISGTREERDLRLSGTVANIERAFHVTMGTYHDLTEDRTFFAVDREPTVDLPFQLWHITGLDNDSKPHPMYVKKSDYAKAHGIDANKVVSHATTGSGPSASFLGSDMRAAYYGGTALTGSGQNIALFEFAGTDLSDLSTYYKNVGQTEPYTPTLISTGGYGTSCVDSGGSACDDTEQTLDMTQAMGMAPGSTMLYMYVCGDVLASGSGNISDTACISSMVSTAAAPLSKQISCSWGWTPADPSTLDPYFEQMASQGQNFFAASGDSSAWSASNEAWPADDANIVSVGGTDLTTSSAAGPWKSETAWADSGGGISPDSIPIPSWQKLSGVITSSNRGSTTLRNGPDVSANANFTFYVCADQTTCTANDYGGTSFATPMWAGYLALANEQAASNGDTIGFIDPIIYPAALTSSYGTYFHDITSGSCGTYSGITGYDLCTGWGSPNTTGIINLLAGSATPSFTLSATPSSLSVTQGNSGTSTITVTDAGGFTGSVTLAASGLPSGVTAAFGTNPTTGTSVLTLTASSTATTGTSTVTITGTSGSLTATTTVALTVSATASPNFTIAASPASLTVTQGAKGTSTITITSTGGFNSATTLSATGLPAGVTAAFSTNPVTPAANGSATSTLTLTASASATVGAATVTITGTSGSTSHSTTIALTVNASSGTKNFTLSLSPSSFTIDERGSVSTTLTVTSVNGFNSAVDLSVNEFPSGVSATASANPVTPPANGSVKVTITWSASRRAPTGTTTIELIGTSGSLTNETPVTITVAP
ncbi:MAG TPA: protease pro-enzyme activation domain-containing protein [Verrucomicrobiae bacterium]|jgi:subtilase family serine protease|nr:protease pro-enzyme activation domain-containing protein [Verrucomicrobiae bacterium]